MSAITRSMTRHANSPRHGSARSQGGLVGRIDRPIASAVAIDVARARAGSSTSARYLIAVDDAIGFDATVIGARRCVAGWVAQQKIHVVDVPHPARRAASVFAHLADTKQDPLATDGSRARFVGSIHLKGGRARSLRSRRSPTSLEQDATSDGRRYRRAAPRPWRSNSRVADRAHWTRSWRRRPVRARDSCETQSRLGRSGSRIGRVIVASLADDPIGGLYSFSWNLLTEAPFARQPPMPSRSETRLATMKGSPDWRTLLAAGHARARRIRERQRTSTAVAAAAKRRSTSCGLGMPPPLRWRGSNAIEQAALSKEPSGVTQNRLNSIGSATRIVAADE